MRRLDLTGHRFGRLTVLELSGKDNHGKPLWKCVCDCGEPVEKSTPILQTGKCRSCGCLRRETSAAHTLSMSIHGEWADGKPTVEWAAWASMRKRCASPKDAAYPHYGGRGITVCERWQTFENFLADMGRRPAGEFSIDRRDNSKGYEPGNCRWATPVEQNNNTRFNRVITLNGKTQSLAMWVREVGINRNKFKNLAMSMGDEAALQRLILALEF